MSANKEPGPKGPGTNPKEPPAKAGDKASAGPTITYRDWKTIVHIVPTADGYRDIAKPRAADVEDDPVTMPLVAALAQVWLGDHLLLKAKQTRDQERAQQAKQAAKAPRPKCRKVDADHIREKYLALRADSYEDRAARVKIERDSKGTLTYQQIYRAVKVLNR